MNPLAALRKRQKVLLAIFGVLLMIVFTVGGIVTNFVGQPTGAPQNAVVVHWRGNELRESDMQRLRVARNQLRSFLQYALQVTRNRGGTPGDPRLQASGVSAELVLESIMPDSEESIVQQLLLAQAAEEAGIVISDQAVLDYLDRLTDGTMQRNEFATILAQVTGNRMSQPTLIDLLRRQLMSWQMQDLARSGVFPATPGAAWHLYRKLNRRIEAQVMPVAAEQFVARVKAPSDQEVREMFEKYKDRLPQPNDPTPGFKLPYRAAFQYVKADFQKFVESVKPTISAEQVETYYNEHLPEFRTSATDGDEFAPLDLEGSLPPADFPSLDAPAQGTGESPAAEDTQTPPADATDAAEPPAEEQPAEEQPAEEQPAEEQPAEEQPAEEQSGVEQPAASDTSASPADPNAAADEPSSASADQPSDDESARTTTRTVAALSVVWRNVPPNIRRPTHRPANEPRPWPRAS